MISEAKKFGVKLKSDKNYQPNFDKFDARSSQYRQDLIAFSDNIIGRIAENQSSIDNLKLIREVITPMIAILDHEFPYGIGLGSSLDDWLEYLIGGNSEMAEHQSKIVLQDKENFFSARIEELNK